MKKDSRTVDDELENSRVLDAPKLMIESRIKRIRGVPVLLTRDLAELYQVEPRAINQAVKRNQERFPEWYCFQLSPEEFDFWKSQIEISKADGKGDNSDNLKSQNVISSWGGARVAPYAFTEQGVAMLSAVLKSKTAVHVSIEIMDAFVAMRRYLTLNQDVLDLKKSDFTLLSLQTHHNSNKIASIEQHVGKLSGKVDCVRSDLQRVMEYFHDPSTYKHHLILNGQRFEADVAYTQIYGMAKQSVIVIDNYVDVKTLDLLRGVGQNIQVTIFSDQYAGCRITQSMENDFKAARPDISFKLKSAGNKFHDRYVVLDFEAKSERIFHCGASSKDAGGKITTIMEVECPEVYHAVIRSLL